MHGKAAVAYESTAISRSGVRVPPAAAAASPHILIADGNQESRTRRQAQLLNAGFRVLVARTGFEAIVKASCYVPDLILLDDSLSALEASETGRLLTTCAVTSHIPVVRLHAGRPLPQAALRRLRGTAVHQAAL